MGNMWWQSLVKNGKALDNCPLFLPNELLKNSTMRFVFAALLIISPEEMLAKLKQLLVGQEVSRPVDDELDDQRRELEKVQADISNVRSQLRDGQRAVDALRVKEETLKSDIEKLIMEVHDPMLSRQCDAEITGDVTSRWEEIPFGLACAGATFQRITCEKEESDTSSDESEDHATTESSAQQQKRVKKNRRDFVALGEHSDVDEMQHSSSSDDDERNQLPQTAAVDVGPARKKKSVDEEEPTEIEAQPEESRSTVTRFEDMQEEDFISPLEFRRWRVYFGRLQQEQMLRSYFAGKIVKDLRERREMVEAKLFERHCDLIHLQAFEEHAMRQLQAYTMRGVAHTNEHPAAELPVVAHDAPPVVNLEERTARVN